jgi:predicted AAA+ superfamily ATPase
LDLFVIRGGKRYGFEFKFADAPSTSKSMRVALADLDLEQLFIVYPGTRGFSLDEKIEAVPLTQLSQRLAGL